MATPYKYPYRPDGWAKDIYPMPAFTQIVVSDLTASSAWYQTVLGFADVFTMRMPDGLPMMAHLRWCTFGDLLLMPTRTSISGARGQGVTLYYTTDDADAIVTRAAERGVKPVEGPLDRPWNVREVTFTDPDGYRLTFGAPTAETLNRAASDSVERMDSVVERLRKTFAK